MNNGIKAMGFFAAGAAIGSLVTWKIAKNTYKKIAKEEIKSVKETFSRREVEDIIGWETRDRKGEYEDDALHVRNDALKHDYEKIASRYGTASDEKSVITECEAYVIPPEEFGALEGYEEISLYYYTDGYVADENDELINNVEDVIGWETLDRMGEYEDDVLHVRNDALKQDYEILRSCKSYGKDVMRRDDD